MVEVLNRKDIPEPFHWPLWYVYIGRPSPLGNPFVIGKDGTREEVVTKYAEWLSVNLESDEAMTLELCKLLETFQKHGKLGLVCWCAPELCHGDVIKRILLSVARGLSTPGDYITERNDEHSKL